MPDHPHQPPRRVQSKWARAPCKLQPRFLGSAVAFRIVAAIAASHQVFPRGASAARTWHDVIQSQFRTRKNLAAELARIAIAQENILSRKRAALLRNMAVGQKPNDRRNLVRVRGRMNFRAVQFLRLSDAL